MRAGRIFINDLRDLNLLDKAKTIKIVLWVMFAILVSSIMNR